LTNSQSNETLTIRGLGRLDLVAAIVILLLAIVLMTLGHREAAEEVRRSGRNVDSGAYESTLAWLILLPMALGFLVASLLRRKNKKFALGFRILACAWPIVFALLVFLTYR
jgi:H+/Cl- antiporter ClcA